MDYVGEYVVLKQQLKEIQEKLASLELFILEEHRDDERISVVAPRKTITIKDEVYDRLEKVGVETDVIEKRKKKLEEFDIDVRTIIESNAENFNIKLSKESIRVK
jgi:predicted CopG family antitoxin